MTEHDEGLIHGLDREQLHEMFRYLVLARAAEERLELLQRQGHVKGGLYRSLGQEGGSVGTAYALRRRTDGTGDVIAHTIRETGALFLFGGTPLEYFRQYLARGTGPTAGKEANVHWTDYQRGFVGPVSPLGSMVEVMAGITLSFKMRGQDRIGVSYYGDGATSTGAWHEGLNFAAVQRCPMILVVEANQYAFSTPTSRQTRVSSFVEKAPGYGIDGESVDGNDVLAVYDVMRRAAARARSGEGVSMVELRYYRRKGHAQHDPQEYVPPEEIREWEAKDPILRYRTLLVERGWATEEELAGIEEAAEATVSEAADRAVGEPVPEPRSAMEDVYSDRVAPVPWTRLPDPDPRRAAGPAAKERA